MKLGLLQCDHASGPAAKIAGDYDAMFRRWIEADWLIYDVTRGERPRDLDECDAYVTTGSSASVYDDVPWIHGFAELVKGIHSSDKPFLGVCFGHQMMAHALGGRVARSPHGWEIGVRRFPIGKREAWMRPGRDEISMLMSCQDQVEQLPADAAVLAGDRQCPVALYRVGNMLGVQGHPEWPAAFAGVLLTDRTERIGSRKVAAAQRSLDQPLDNELLAQWAARFFRSVRTGIDLH